MSENTNPTNTSQAPSTLTNAINNVCHGCREEVSPGYLYCPNCGRKLSQDHGADQGKDTTIGPKDSPVPEEPSLAQTPTDQGNSCHKQTCVSSRPVVLSEDITDLNKDDPSINPCQEAKTSGPVCEAGAESTPSPANAGMASAYQLVSCDKGGHRNVYSLMPGETTLGTQRDCNYVIINDPWVSRMHARITSNNGQIFVVDNNSKNGTFLKLQRPVPLMEGEEILVGTTLIRLERIQNP